MADALERAGHEAAAAGEGGGVAQPRDVAAFMNDVLGQELAQQREGVRVWLAQRNDRALTATSGLRIAARPPGPQSATLPSGQQAIVAPLPAPQMPAGLKSTPPPPFAIAPVVNAPHPDDGDPTTLRVMSGTTQGAMSIRSQTPAELAGSQRGRNARIAAVVGGA